MALRRHVRDLSLLLIFACAPVKTTICNTCLAEPVSAVNGALQWRLAGCAVADEVDDSSTMLAWSHPMAACNLNRELWTGASPSQGCSAIAEWQFVTEVLLRDFSLTTFGSAAVVVTHVSELTSFEVKDELARTGQLLRSLGVPACLIHLSDEAGTVDDFYDSWPCVLRQYWNPKLFQKWYPKLAFIPLGFATGHASQKKNAGDLRRTSERPVNWTFVGFGGHATRPKMLQEMDRALTGGVIHRTNTVTVGFKWSQEMWEAPRIASIMRISKLCPAPMGFVAPESFRLWEALEADCIPILDAVDIARGENSMLHDRDYFPQFFRYLTEMAAHIDNETGLVAPHHPVLAHDWEDAANQLADALIDVNREAELDNYQVAQAEWWAYVKDGLHAYLRHRLDSLRQSI